MEAEGLEALAPLLSGGTAACHGAEGGISLFSVIKKIIIYNSKIPIYNYELPKSACRFAWGVSLSII